jgi:hypothetical protein
VSNQTTLDVNPEHLLTAFRAVSPHRGTDKLLPVFLDVKVRIERESKTVSVTATDRYTIARDTVVTTMSSQWEDDANGRPWVDAWEWTFSPDQVKMIMSLCRDSIKAKHPVIPLFPVLGLGNESELEVGYGRERFRSTGVSWPKVDHILGKPLHDDETNPPARVHHVNPAYLARFDAKHVARKSDNGAPLIMTFGRVGNVAHVTYSDHFVGAIMTMRQPSA